MQVDSLLKLSNLRGVGAKPFQKKKKKKKKKKREKKNKTLPAKLESDFLARI